MLNFFFKFLLKNTDLYRSILEIQKIRRFKCIQLCVALNKIEHEQRLRRFEALNIGIILEMNIKDAIQILQMNDKFKLSLSDSP